MSTPVTYEGEDNCIAIGNHAEASLEHCIALGNNAKCTESYEINFGNRVHFYKDGRIKINDRTFQLDEIEVGELREGIKDMLDVVSTFAASLQNTPFMHRRISACPHIQDFDAARWSLVGLNKTTHVLCGQCTERQCHTF